MFAFWKEKNEKLLSRNKYSNSTWTSSTSQSIYIRRKFDEWNLLENFSNSNWRNFLPFNRSFDCLFQTFSTNFYLIFNSVQSIEIQATTSSSSHTFCFLSWWIQIIQKIQSIILQIIIMIEKLDNRLKLVPLGFGSKKWEIR